MTQPDRAPAPQQSGTTVPDAVETTPETTPEPTPEPTPQRAPGESRESAQHTPRRKRVPRAEREQQILAVAEEVFAERGFQATSMDEVSLRVGVSKPMLYEYFNSKEGLLLACVARIRADLQDATVRAVDSARADGPRAILRAGLEAYYDFADRHGRAWAVLLNESVIVAGPAEAAIEAIRGQQTELMAGLLASWLTDESPQRVTVFAHALIGAGERVARWRLREGAEPVSARETAAMLTDLFWPGFAAAADGRDG